MKDNFGWANRRALKRLEKIADKIEKLESFYETMNDEQLKSQTLIFKQELAKGKTLDDILPQAFAVCREASKRVLNQRHYHVQLLGAIALHQGRICQMATGEGKTLTETLPAYLNALTEKGVHIVTVNPYLASRDAEWMGKVFKFLGLTVGVIETRQGFLQKKHAYLCDITYGTSSEFGFDYLRDNRVSHLSQKVQRDLNYALIDEVDSILIDEARTPLIISEPAGEATGLYQKADAFVRRLKKSTNCDSEGNVISTKGERLSAIERRFTKTTEEPNGDYVLDEKNRSATLTEKGILEAERFFDVSNLSGDGLVYDPDVDELNNYINNALQAHAVFHRDIDYVVENRQVVIVDENTGRKLPGRRFNNGLHQAIEAKERVPILKRDKTVATVTLQNYFRLYRKVSGMTGTAKTEEKEFMQIYDLDVVCIPTNLPNKRVDRPDKIYKTRKGKMNALLQEVERAYSLGQPILLGTSTVEKSDELSQLLKAKKIPHNVLNAKNHEKEAEIIAQAGKKGSVTIATNMAGRGTDILLGGNPEFLAKSEMLALGYTHEQIELATSFIENNEEIGALQKVFRTLVDKHKVETNKNKQEVVALGGLLVVGAEKNEALRIDNQLRGRSGRQGDVGETVFYVSAEDDMMRLYADKLNFILNVFNWDENEAIESKMITKTLNDVQKTIEGRHFSARKHVLQFDDVNNVQRNTIYAQRNLALSDKDILSTIEKMVPTFARKVLEYACSGNEDTSTWNLEKVNERLSQINFLEEFALEDKDVFRKTARQVHQLFIERTLQALKSRCEEFTNAQTVVEKLACVYALNDIDVFNILQFEDEFKELADQWSFDIFAKSMYRVSIDKLWEDHIDNLEELKRGVGLQSIGQHDPLSVYKRDAYRMFADLQENLEYSTVLAVLKRKFVFKVSFGNDPNAQKRVKKEKTAQSVREDERKKRIEERKRKEKENNKKINN